MISYARDLSLLMPEIVVLLATVLALVCEMLRLPRIALAIAAFGLLAATGLAAPLLGLETTAFGGTFRVGALSVWAKLILLPATALSLLLARTEVRGTDREGTVYVLLCLTTLGALLLAGAGDTMLLVLGLLLSSLGSFALVAYPRDDRATEAAMKYFVFGSVTGGVMIFGLTYWFGATGSTLLADLNRLEPAPIVGAFGFVAVLVGLGYKASLVPFHFWAPDAYDGAPVSVAAFLSVVPKIGAVFALAQVAVDLPAGSGWPFAVAGVGALSMTYGALAALVQRNVVRLLAYSSIAQSGFFMLGFVALGVSPLGQRSIIVFAAAYAAMNLGAFAIVAHAGRNTDAFRGFGRQHPVGGVAMVVFLISLVGVPPLAGFVGKFLLFGAAMNSGYLWFAVVGIANSVIALAAYLRIVIPMYEQPTETQAVGGRVLLTGIWAGAATLTVLIGLAAQVLMG